MLSTRYMFTISAAGFTLMSLACATASSINEMILYRALQGFIGGGMIPTVFASAYTAFPPARRLSITPLIGLVATLAPTIGPTIGGYPDGSLLLALALPRERRAGIFVTVTTWLLVDFDEPDHSLFSRFDWVGLISMGAMLAASNTCLRKGRTTTGSPKRPCSSARS